MMKTISILIFVLSFSFCSTEIPPLLSKNLWQTVGKYVEPKHDKKLSLTDKKLNKISAYENVKQKACPECQAKWGFLKHLETEEIFVENDFKTLPWNKPTRDALYSENHSEIKPFILCVNYCFDLSYRSDFEPDLALALVRFESDVNARDSAKQSSLHWAVYFNSEEVVKILIEAGADKEAMDIYGDTALHKAASNDNVKVVRILIEEGADIEARNIYGDTALHKAAFNDNLEIVRFLIQAGADKDAKNIDGKTALHILKEKGHATIANLLAKQNKIKFELSKAIEAAVKKHFKILLCFFVIIISVLLFSIFSSN